jgi:hypothetical protein
VRIAEIPRDRRKCAVRDIASKPILAYSRRAKDSAMELLQQGKGNIHRTLERGMNRSLPKAWHIDQVRFALNTARKGGGADE